MIQGKRDIPDNFGLSSPVIQKKVAFRTILGVKGARDSGRRVAFPTILVVKKPRDAGAKWHSGRFGFKEPRDS